MTPTDQHGFTLIELLLVVSIILFLVAVVSISMSEPRGKARDSERLNDLRQAQNALQLYFNRNKTYPVTGAGVSVPISDLADELGPYVEELPLDPIGNRGTEGYRYSSERGQDFGLRATSEDGTSQCKLRTSGSNAFEDVPDCPFN